MASLIYYEEAYEIYKKERKTAEDRYMKWLLIWLACLPLAIVTGVGIYEGMVEYPGDDAAALFGCILIMVLSLFMLCWLTMNRSIRKARISRLNFDMSTLLMSESLRESFGDFTKERVKYCIFQSHCKYGQDVKLHEEFSWKNAQFPLLFHRARITNGKTGEDEETYFQGFALSVPAQGELWTNMDPEGAAKALKTGWEGVLTQYIPGRPMFALDTINGKLWLTAGFDGWYLGENHVPWHDLNKWHEKSQEEVKLLKYAVNVVRSITPEDVMKYYSVKKR